MLVDNEFLHNVELDIRYKVFHYLKHEKEYELSPCIYVNTRSGRVVMGDHPDWKCYGRELAMLLCTTYMNHRVADTKRIHQWVWKELFAHCQIW